MDAPHTQKPLELILARNLITSISTPAFLLDENARLVYANEAAGALLGMSFEESGRMDAEEWTRTFGPFDDEGNPLAVDDLGPTGSVRAGRPAHARFMIRSVNGTEHQIEATAFPIVASEHGSSGAMILFWPLDEDWAASGAGEDGGG
jgi:PAS domain-containing protein